MNISFTVPLHELLLTYIQKNCVIIPVMEYSYIRPHLWIIRCRMSKLFSSSPPILGLIEDIEISKIKRSPHSYRSVDVKDIDELAKSIKEKGLF